MLTISSSRVRHTKKAEEIESMPNNSDTPIAGGTESVEKPRTIFVIPDSKIQWLDQKIEKLNKVAKKLGLPPVGYKVLESNIAQTAVDPEGETGLTSYIRTATKIEIFGEAPQIKGWKFVARILHDEGGNVIKSVPGEQLPPQYRMAEPKCDHCGYKRRRNDTFVLKNTQTGEFKQVGSNCLSDFLGHGSPRLYASFAENMADFADELDGMQEEWEGGGGGGFARSVNIEYYLKVVFGVIKTRGWLSRAEAQEKMRAATADIALNLIYGARKDPKTKKDLEEVLSSITADDESMLNDALVWARSLKEGSDAQTEQLSDYYWNLSVACSQEMVKSRTEGIVASLPIAYDKAVLKTIKPDAKSVVGNKGQMVVVKGKIVDEKMFSDNVVYDILTEDNKMVRCTFPANTQLEGKDVVVEGTVTGYSRKFTYVITVLSRVKFLNADEYSARQQELQQQQQQQQQSPKPEYVPGQKVTMNVTVLKMREMDTQYGRTTLVTMVDDFGMTVKWWASNVQGLREGEKANITATVKGLGDYKGTPEVTITRPKINSRVMDLQEGHTDPRLPAAEVRVIKKQLRDLEEQFNQLCYGYSKVEDPSQGLSIQYDRGGRQAWSDMYNAIKSIFPPAFYEAARCGAHNDPNVDPEKIFVTDNLEAVVDAHIKGCQQHISYNREQSWEESAFEKSNRYDIDYAEREKNAFEVFISRWPGTLQKIRAISHQSEGGYVSTWSVERQLEYLPYEIKRKLKAIDSSFWTHKLRGVPSNQWADVVQQTLEPLFAEYAQMIEQKLQDAFTKMRGKHEETRQRIQQEESELQEVIQNKAKYVAKLQQLLESTPFRSFLLAAPKRESLSKQYQELYQRLWEHKESVKQYGPLESAKKRQANWLINLLEKMAYNFMDPKRIPNQMMDHALNRLRYLVEQATTEGELINLKRELERMQGMRGVGYGAEIGRLIQQKRMQLGKV